MEIIDHIFTLDKFVDPDGPVLYHMADLKRSDGEGPSAFLWFTSALRAVYDDLCRTHHWDFDVSQEETEKARPLSSWTKMRDKLEKHPECVSRIEVVFRLSKTDDTLAYYKCGGLHVESTYHAFESSYGGQWGRWDDGWCLMRDAACWNALVKAGYLGFPGKPVGYCRLPRTSEERTHTKKKIAKLEGEIASLKEALAKEGLPA